MKKKGYSIYKKTIFFLVFAEVSCIFLMVTGYTTASNIMKAGNPQKYLRTYNIYSVIMIIVLGFMFTITGLSILKSVRNGGKQASYVTLKLAEGDTEIEIGEIHNDEFGKLLEEYMILIEATELQANIAREVADGNLTIKVEPRGEKDVLGLALRQMVERNHHALSNINESAFQVMTSSNQVASASEALAQGSTEQASAIQEITSSMAEIAEKTKQNASQANDANKLVTNAIDEVKQGNERMKEMMSAMNDINVSSENISRIIKVIDDIAFQTNILALNAAVEAARAGEAGKGFAVVAEEVRNLAAKSADAASETAEMIEDSIRKVEIGSKIANDTANALELITEDVSKSGQLIIGIAEASNYQASAVAQINQAINQVSEVVQTNSATSEECAAASEELSIQAAHMQELLSIYQLGTSSANIKVRPEGRADKQIPKSIDLGDIHDKPSNNRENNPNEAIISLDDGFGKY